MVLESSNLVLETKAFWNDLYPPLRHILFASAQTAGFDHCGIRQSVLLGNAVFTVHCLNKYPDSRESIPAFFPNLFPLFVVPGIVPFLLLA